MYKIDPAVTELKDGVREDLIKKINHEGIFGTEKELKIFMITLAIDYCHEFFRMAEVISDQLDEINRYNRGRKQGRGWSFGRRIEDVD